MIDNLSLKCKTTCLLRLIHEKQSYSLCGLLLILTIDWVADANVEFQALFANLDLPWVSLANDVTDSGLIEAFEAVVALQDFHVGSDSAFG